MRSALTDAPVASFTTLLLRATQHATGFMVKVAPPPTERPALITKAASLDTHKSIAASVAGRWSNRLQIAISSGFGRTVSI